MKQYHALLEHILANGADKDDRTGTGTRSVFGYQMRFDLAKGFPLVTTKKTSFKNILTELLWFIRGNPSIDFLHEHGCHIWDEWVKPNGTFGPIYGAQWRSWGPGLGIDQLQNAINTLKTNPDDRRMIVSAWNVTDVESGDMALPPCHVMFQFYSAPMNLSDRTCRLPALPQETAAKMLGMDDIKAAHRQLDERGTPRRKLSCQLYQRSCDTFLGVPYNIASYALLTHMVAQLTGHAVGDFVWTGGDVHIYKNHFDKVHELLRREVRPLPTLKLQAKPNIDDYVHSDFELVGYNPWPTIKAEVAV